MNAINTIVFDMDGVLLDSEPLWLKAQADIFAKVNITITPAMHHSTMGIRATEIVKNYYDKFPWDNYTTEQVNDMLVLRVVHYIKAEAILFDGLLEFLQDCKRKNIKMAICSSADIRIIKSVVKKFQLDKYITHFHSVENEEFGKPHPAGYLSTMKLLKSHPSESIVFEDSVMGAIAGKASGARLVAIPNPESKASDFAFSDFIYEKIRDIKIDDIIQ